MIIVPVLNYVADIRHNKNISRRRVLTTRLDDHIWAHTHIKNEQFQKLYTNINPYI